jgi:hypothetical protein
MERGRCYVGAELGSAEAAGGWRRQAPLRYHYRGLRARYTSFVAVATCMVPDARRGTLPPPWCLVRFTVYHVAVSCAAESRVCVWRTLLVRVCTAP